MKLSRLQSSMPTDTQLPVAPPSQSHGLADVGPAGGGADFRDGGRGRNAQVITNPNHAFYSSSIFVTTDVKPLVGPDPTRRYLLIQNKGPSTVFIGFNNSPGAGGENGIELNSGFQLSFEDGIVPNTTILVRANAAAGADVTILQGRES